MRSKTPLVRTKVPPFRASRFRIATALFSETSLGFAGMGEDEDILEELLRLLEELARNGLVRVAAHAREVLEQLPLLRAKRRRHLHVDPHELVPVAAAAQRRHAALAQPERRPALRPRRYLQAGPARERRDLDRPAEHRERELDRDLAGKVVALALEELVLLHAEHDVEVPRPAAGGGSLAVSGGPQPRARLDPRRDADVELRRLCGAALAAAHRARPIDPHSRAPAGRAGLREDDDPARAADLAGAPAGRARHALGSRLGAGAVAVLASDQLAE